MICFTANMKRCCLFLFIAVLVNASGFLLAENIENNTVLINEVQKDVNNYDNASVKTETAISTEENVETTNTDVIDNGSNVVMTNAENDNNSASNADDKVVIAQYELNKANDEKETQIAEKNDGNVGVVTNISSKQVKIIGTNGENNFVNYYNIGIDLYFSTSQSTFSTITGVDSYNVGNRVYTFGINANFSWKLQSGLHMFAGLGVKYDWFDKYSSGVIGSKMSPSIGFYGMFGMKIIVSKYFAVEPYINIGAIFLGNGKVQYSYSYSYYSYYHSYRYGPRRSMNVVGMMTALGVDFVFFKVLTLGVQLQYNMFSCEKFNGALIGLGHEARLLNQQRWQHHIAIAGKIGLKFDSLYLSM